MGQTWLPKDAEIWAAPIAISHISRGSLSNGSIASKTGHQPCALSSTSPRYENAVSTANLYQP